MSFQEVIQSLPNVGNCFEKGLQALGTYRTKIFPADARNCSGSVDLDNCLKVKQPQASRWDYIIGYNDESYFAEVHSASGQVSKVIEKTNWLRNWLKNEGELVARIYYKGKNFHWIPTNGVKIIGNQRALLAQNKIIIVNRLSLPYK